MKKIYISHKFEGEDKDQLKQTLERISSIFKRLNIKTFIFFRDKENWNSDNPDMNWVINTALSELKDCDSLFALVLSEAKSEGLLLEVGYAKALNKKMILAIKKGVKTSFLKEISDYVIEFENLDELEIEIPKLLKQ